MHIALIICASEWVFYYVNLILHHNISETKKYEHGLKYLTVRICKARSKPCDEMNT